jgi:hypothetical protein
MVKNKIGGNKSKNISNRNTKKIISVPDPDFENSFLGIIKTKPNGLMANVSLILPKNYIGNQDIFKEPLQVNIGKLKHDKRNQLLSVGDIVQVECSPDMKRQNGNVFATILCKYDGKDIKRFKQEGWIPSDQSQEEDDIFVLEDDVNLEDL